MKLSAFLFFLGVMQVLANNSSAQKTKLSLDNKNASIESILLEIESKSEYKFIYNKEKVDVDAQVNIQLQDKSVIETLDILFEGRNIIYTLFGNNIVLSNAEVSNVQTQQQKSISGKVTDSSGIPLPGVTVVVKGTTNGTITDVNGMFTLTLAPENTTLQFSFVGMKSKEINVEGKTKINVTLSEESIGLEEVVAVGYGTQKKINLTGAVGVASSAVMENRSMPNVAQTLRGIIPNLNIQSTTAGGEPGATQTFNIRGLGSLSGNSSPYILVDGVPMDINNVNPGDVESISVLKDAASSAIYGARAAYGVILITTKSGSKQEGLTVTYSTNFTSSSPTLLPKTVDSKTFALAANEIAGNTGQAPIFDAAALARIDAFQADPINTPGCIQSSPSQWGNWQYTNANTDWWKYAFTSSLRQKHNLSLNGSTGNTSYYFSLGYMDEPGMIRGAFDRYDRYNFTGSVMTKVNDWLSLDIKTKYIYTDNNIPNAWTAGGTSLLIHQLSRLWPTYPTVTPSGDPYPYESPMIYYQEGGYNKVLNNDLWISPKITITPLKNWDINLEGSWNTQGNSETNQMKTIYWQNPDQSMSKVIDPSLTKKYEQNYYYNINAFSSYSVNFGKHFSKIMVGYQEELRKNSSINGYYRDYISIDVPAFNTSTGTYTLGDAMSHWSTRGYFGRFNYSYNDKFLFEANGRYDGSSRFQEGKRYGFFPSFSAGYILTKDGWFKNILPALDLLKIRGSFGTLGNQNVANYLYLTTLKVNSQLSWITEGKLPPYVKAPNLVSPDLTWEKSSTIDFGFDAALLKNKLSATFDWYQRKTTDMFGPDAALPALLGTGVPQTNNATLSTTGFELSLTWKQKLNNGLNYSITASLADNKSVVEKYNNPTKILTTWYEGQTVGEIWGFETAGIFQTQEEANNWVDQKYFYSKWGPGDVKYNDLNGDLVINRGDNTVNNPGDQKVIGNSKPRYMFGLNLSAEYKGFDLMVMLDGIGKQDAFMNSNFYFGSLSANSQSSFFTETMNYWSPSNTQAFYPKPYFSAETNKNRQVQTRFLSDVSYLRVRNIQLGYNVPVSKLHLGFIKSARLYVGGENLAVLTNLIKTMDPEVINGGQGYGKAYPIAKSYSLGVNITF